MSFLKKIGGQAGNLVKKGGELITGTSKDAGLFGQFKGEKYDYDKKAFSSKENDVNERDFTKRLKDVDKRKASSMDAAQIDERQQAEFRNAQSRLLADLEAQSRGDAPSLAQAQLRSATDRNLAQQMAAAATMRGPSAGAGVRSLANQAANQQQALAQQSSELRLQEQMAARDQIGNVAQSARGQDIALGQAQADFRQQANQANLEAQIEAQRQKDALAQFYSGNIAQQRNMAQQNRQELERLRGQQSLGVQGINQAAYQEATKGRQGFVSGILESAGMSGKAAPGASGAGAGAAPPAGAAAAGSDKNMKKDIKKADESEISDFLEKIKPYTYEYKNPFMDITGEGKMMSPMAQDMEKTEIGKGMVQDTDEGKVVNYAKAGGFLMALGSMLNGRVDDLEDQLKKVLSSKKAKG